MFGPLYGTWGHLCGITRRAIDTNTKRLLEAPPCHAIPALRPRLLATCHSPRQQKFDPVPHKAPPGQQDTALLTQLTRLTPPLGHENSSLVSRLQRSADPRLELELEAGAGPTDIRLVFN